MFDPPKYLMDSQKAKYTKYPFWTTMTNSKHLTTRKRKFERKLSKSQKGPKDKQFTSYIRSKTKGRTSVGPLIDDHGNKVSEDKDVAEALNQFFSSVFTIEGDGQ